VIKTTAEHEILDKEASVDCYWNLQKVEQVFKNMKTVMLEHSQIETII